MTTRRIIIISAVVLVVIIGVFIYLSMGRGPATSGMAGQTGTLPSAVTGGGNLPAVGNNASGTANTLSLVDAGPDAAYVINASGTAIVVHADGTIYSVLNGQESSLSSTSIADLVSASFSHDAAKIVVSSGNPINPQVSIFDVATRSWLPFTMGAISPVWSPVDSRLAYLHDNGNGTESLMTFDASKSKSTAVKLGTFNVQDMVLSWPNASDVMLSTRPSASVGGSAFMFDLMKDTLTLTAVGRPGMSTVWNASPLMALQFTAGPVARGGNLQFIDSAGDTLQNLSFLSLPSKCTFAQGLVMPSSTTPTGTATSSNTVAATSSLSAPHYQFVTYLYCGVPRDQDSLSYDMLPDSYAEHAVYTSDNIYQIDVTTGNITTLFADTSQNFDVSSPLLVGNKFYFINRYDQKLYSIFF